MFRKQRMALASVAAVGVLAVVAPGLTAGINLPENAAAPAAGQGVAVLQGFDVENINWDISADGDITEVSFNIVRDGPGAALVTAAADENSGNAIVRVRLEGDNGATPAAWASCDVVDDANATPPTSEATCTLSATAPSQQMKAETLGQVNIIAFDRN
jgi:hypothetical protein